MTAINNVFMTNAKISECQALKQQFCLRINRSHFAKSDQDQGSAQTCGDERKMFQATKNRYIPANKVLYRLTVLVNFPLLVLFSMFGRVVPVHKTISFHCLRNSG